MKYQILSHPNYFRQKQPTGKSGYVSALFVAFSLFIEMGATASAQIVPDNTLPNNSAPSVLPISGSEDNLIQINGGTTVGNNLFHSFEQFSLSTADIAWFNNALTIDNIITRVTGGSISSIDGLIRANGTANLFLINPNGIVFGQNAVLEIGGSFIGSTANSIKFADGSEFSAVDPQAPPLLTVNIPIGLQYGTNNGDIVVQGSGNQLQFNPDFTVNRDSRPVGLQVDSGQTLALVGGNVFLEGGNLTAEAGRIELGSVNGNSLVKLNPNSSSWSLDYSEVSNFQDIYLSQASSLEVSGNGGGDVQLQGREVIITDGSAILADTLGDSDGGKLGVNASELLVVAGTSSELPFISRLSTDVSPRAIGNGGDIELNGGTVIVTDGAQVVSSTYGSGNTGNIKVKADDVELISGSRIAFSSGLFTLVFGSGNGGEVDIEANNIFVLDGAQAAALTFSDGDGGNLNVKANHVELTGTSPGGASSSFSTNTEGAGNGGDLTIDSEYLLVADGGLVQASVFSSGDSGNLVVKATEVELISGAPGVRASGLFANVEQEATGNGGTLAIETEYLFIADGAQVAITTFGDGDAGLLDVKANEIELIGTSPGGNSSGLFSNVEATATGTGGSLAVETESLLIADGARVGVLTFGEGDAGILEIKANEIELIGTSPGGNSSGLFSNVEATATGNGGEINIEAEKLQIVDGAEIATITRSSGVAGDTNIKADEINLVGISPDAPSAIFSTVQEQAEGDGGHLGINTRSLKVTDGAQIAVSTAGFGDGGELNITADRVELIGGSEFGASGIFGNAISSTGDGGDVRISTNSLNIQDGATISASNFSSSGNAPPGQGKAGNIFIDANSVKLDKTSADISSTITASTNAGGGGEIILNVAESIILNNNSQIAAETKGSGNGGRIAVNTNSLELNNGGLLSTSTEASGNAGKIEVQADTITFTGLDSGIFSEVKDSATGDGGSVAITAKTFNLNNQAQVSTNSTGLGQAGNIFIAADQINTNQGEITATSTRTGGGNINLDTDFLFLDNNSLISTSVLDSIGGGGNIFIDSTYVIAQENSDLRANAVFGSGGNIDITTEVIFLSFDSEIDASSQFGLDGVVEISNPESDEKIGVIQLPTKITNPTDIITTNCALEQDNTLIVTGKGGLSENPSQYLRSQSVWEDLRDFEHTTASASNNEIIEAKEWVVNEKGNIELLTHLPFNRCRK